jgi:hypothetical protein
VDLEVMAFVHRLLEHLLDLLVVEEELVLPLLAEELHVMVVVVVQWVEHPVAEKMELQIEEVVEAELMLIQLQLEV